MRLRLKADKPACIQKAVLNTLCSLDYTDRSLACSFYNRVCEQFRIDGLGLCERPNRLRNIIKPVCCPFCFLLNCAVSNILFDFTSVLVERVEVV